ncbi:MAG: hypothetical protein KAT18_05460, partial [Candidatus Latescibacteria bacterium]|nr:hypothetical protein [Candidatus Latescibacterota bacterium]
MKQSQLILLLAQLLSLLLVAGKAAGQEVPAGGVFGPGLTVEYGLGSYSVTDEYFSAEKYSGTLPYLRVNWCREHERNIYQLGLEVRTSSAIRNYSVSTDIMQFSLVQGFLYPLLQTSLFNRDVHIFVGPSTEIFVLMNTQDLAVSALGFGLSTSALISLGARAEIVMPLSPKLSAESSLQAGLLSLGIRAVDDEMSDDAAAPKVLTPLAGTNASFRLGLRYRLSGAFYGRL